MTRRDRARQACLALLLAAGLAAFALAFQAPVAWMLLAVPAAALFLRIGPLPTPLALTLIWISRALLFAAGAIVANDLFAAAPATGLALGVLSGLFLLDPRSFSPARAFLPAAFGVFLLASANPSPPHLEPLTWTGAAALVTWVVLSSEQTLRWRRIAALVLFLVPAVAIAEGIARFLPWAQPHVETAAMRALAPKQGESGVALGAMLGQIEQLALSPQVILRMWGDEPLALRAGVYTEFDGRHWRARKGEPPPVPLVAAGPVPLPADGEELVPGEWRTAPGARVAEGGRHLRIVMESSLHGVLPAPASVQAVRSATAARRDRFGVVSSHEREPATYGVSHLGRPEEDMEASDAALCLRLPRIDPRVADLARELGGEDGAVAEKIARTVAHLRSRCRYSLKVGRWKTKDPLAEFLFDKKQGYCE